MSKHTWRDPHMIRAARALVRAVYTGLGSFLILFVLFHIVGALYVARLAATARTQFQEGIAHDLAHLKEQGDAVANNDLIKNALLEQRYDDLSALLKTERAQRDIGLMGVANKEGVVVSRTKSVGVVGDNVFLTNPVARSVAQGTSAESVEAPVGFDPNQLFLNTGRPLQYNGEMIGALFANYLTDDAYAQRFQTTYLPAGVRVVFYNKHAGVYGNGFTDEEIRSRVSSYFNSGSDWIQNPRSGTTIAFGDGTFYLVETITFPGLEQSPGGAFIFIPRRDISGLAQIITALLTLGIFLALAGRHHLHSRTEERGWRYYALLGLVSLVMFGATITALRLQNTGYVPLRHIPYTLYNSTLRIQPEFGVYEVGYQQQFSVVVDTGDEAINAVKIGLVFDPQAIDVRAMHAVSSTCSYVIESTIDTDAGRAQFACVMIAAEGRRGALPIVTIVGTPRRAGSFTLAFDTDETEVRAHDGLGTNVLRMAQSSSYRADTFAATTTTRIVVFSPTHPNQSRWYNTPTARFMWRGKPGMVYAYAFDGTPDTIPSPQRTTTTTDLTLPVQGDGIFYFHLRSLTGGRTTHYRVQVDTAPPLITDLSMSAATVVKGDVVRFSFAAEDRGSGVQKNYYINLGNQLFVPIGSQLFVPFLTAGDQPIVLRVYDDAGNYAERTRVVHVVN